eukprot:Skav212764  [mRNA]  locus=scaffold2545:459275:460264:- [translate_table: standard]
MDVWGAPGRTPGDPMKLSTCEFGESGTDHAWVREYGLFRNVLSSLCLDVEGYAANNGATVQITGCDLVEAKTGKVTDQIWNPQAPEGAPEGQVGTYLINQAEPSRCLTIEGEDFSIGAGIILQDCEFNGNNRTSQLWELVEVCRIQGTTAFTQNCVPTCKKSEYIQDNLCVSCPSGQFSQDNQCRFCPANQFWDVLEEVCNFCPDGKQVTADMQTCEDQTFLGLTEIQWAALATALAALSLVLCVFLTISRCRQSGWCQATSTSAHDSPEAESSGHDAPVAESPAISGTPLPARSSSDSVVEADRKPAAASKSSPYEPAFKERLEEVQV